MLLKKILSIIIIGLFNFNSLAQTPPIANLESGYTVKNGYIIYPSPDAEYGNVIDVGPGKTYTEIHDIPLNLIIKNTLIKIFHRSTPYRTKVFVDVIANENEKVRFQGIPNADGILPIITFENATTWGNTINTTLESGSTFVVFGTWDNKPSWIDIVNLHIKDGPYAGVWAKGDNISVKGCILEGNANGVFFQAANQLLIEISTNMLIEGCKFTNNGTVGGWLHHNIYSQGMNCLIQFNTIEKLQTGALGSSLKDRSSHTVIRYNYIETSSRTIDLVEPEDTDQVITLDSDWDDAYVYGNLMINTMTPVSGAGVSMIHFGYDNTPTHTREGVLFFANNTVIIDRNDGIWRMNLFDLNSTNAMVDFSNNIITAKGMHVFNIFRSNNTDNAGNINIRPSWFTITDTDSNSWHLNENSGSYSMTGQSNVLEGSDPGFIDSENDNYSLDGSSPCISVGENIMSSLNFSSNYNTITSNSIEIRTDQNTPSLGSFSSNSTVGIENFNFSGQNISKAYPNPFKKDLIINYRLKEPTHCKIVIYDINGKVLKEVLNVEQNAGEHYVSWNGRNNNNKKVSKGIYFYTIQTKNYRETHKIIRF